MKDDVIEKLEMIGTCLAVLFGSIALFAAVVKYFMLMMNWAFE